MYREHLKAAGIARTALFERSSTRQHIRLHDARAVFITLALGAGRTERWVADRTGHKSSQQIAKYYRAARTATELGLGWLRPMDELIPEFRRSSPGGRAPSRPAGNGIRKGIRDDE